MLPLLLALCFLAPAAGEAAEDATVARVLAANLLELADGRVLRLAGIRLPAEAQRDAADPATSARAALADLAEGRPVRLELADPALDRHGRLVAQLWRGDGLWLQGALLERGLVQVQTRPGEVALAAEMIAREDAARRAGAGIWAQHRFAPRRAEQVASLVGSFQIVEGRIQRVAPTERYIYLNFGADWRTDFTVRIARDAAPGFQKTGMDLEGLTGRLVEVRGYLLEAGGPLIELSHPEQMRVLR